MQHSGAQQRQRDGDEPEAHEVAEHAHQRIAAGAEHADDLHIRDIAEAILQRAEDRHGVGRRNGRRRKIVAHGKQGDERMPRGDHRQAHNKPHQRHQHGKPPCVSHTAPDLSASDGFADHDDAGVAKTDKERKGKLRKRLEDGHAGIVLIAHVGIDTVERDHAERPQSFVRHDRQRTGAELAELLPRKREKLPHRANQHVLFKR